MAAFYPSPAGATESLLDLGAWDRLVADNPPLATLTPDTEALLARTGEGSGSDRGGAVAALVVPIYACYELVGHLRRLWRGFDGGAEARRAVDRFSTDVAGRCR